MSWQKNRMTRKIRRGHYQLGDYHIICEIPGPTISIWYVITDKQYREHDFDAAFTGISKRACIDWIMEQE